MGKHKRYLSIGSISVLAAIIIVWIFFYRARRGIVEGTVVDQLSQGPVWHATVVLGDRSTVKFNSTEFILRKISPGEHILRVSAPNYMNVTKPIVVKPGSNIVHIEMKASGIPGLKGILAFAEPLEKGLQVEIRLTDADGVAITNHPAIECRLEVALYLRKGESPHYEKGRLLFKGPVDISWDMKDSLARYKGVISWREINTAPGYDEIGMLEATLFTSQGTFTFTNDEIEISQRVLQ